MSDIFTQRKLNIIPKLLEFGKWQAIDNKNLSGIRAEDASIYASRYGYDLKDVEAFLYQSYASLKCQTRRRLSREERFSLVRNLNIRPDELSYWHSKKNGIKIDSVTFSAYQKEFKEWPHSTATKPWASTKTKKKAEVFKPQKAANEEQKTKLNKLWLTTK
jgi:hypothetical protein